jgi:hypothetical protein
VLGVEAIPHQFSFLDFTKYMEKHSRSIAPTEFRLPEEGNFGRPVPGSPPKATGQKKSSEVGCWSGFYQSHEKLAELERVVLKGNPAPSSTSHRSLH